MSRSSTSLAAWITSHSVNFIVSSLKQKRRRPEERRRYYLLSREQLRLRVAIKRPHDRISTNLAVVAINAGVGRFAVVVQLRKRQPLALHRLDLCGREPSRSAGIA